MNRFIRVLKTDIQDNEYLNIYYALKNANIIKGSEHFRFQEKGATSFGHLNQLSKKAKIDFVKSLDDSFYKRSKVYTDISDLAENIYNRSIQNGGSTTFVDTGLAVTTGYLVAGLQNAPSWVGTSLSTQIIEKFIYSCYDNWFKQANSEKRYYLGTWLNKANNKWYLDISHDAGSEKNAIDLCKERGEIAYYDMQKGEDVYIDSI